MKIKASLKIAIIMIISQWKQLVFGFAVFPLIIALVMGNFQKDVFNPDVTRDKININIVDNDNSKVSENFKELFNTKELKNIFNVTNESQYTITIPKGYENNLINLKESTIKIDEKKRVSRSNELIIRNVIEQYGKSLTQGMIISNKIQDMNINHKQKLYDDVINSINKFSSTPSIKQNLVKGYKVLTSYENQAAAMMTFMLFSIVMSCVFGFDMDKENGSNKRLLSTPMTKYDFFNLDLFNYFISSVIFGAMYIAAFRITGMAFKGINLFIIIALLLCQSILVACFSGMIIAFFKKNAAKYIVIILLYMHIIFGGGFVPLKDIDNNIFLNIAKFSPGNIITKAYTNCLLFNSFSSISKYLLIMILVSLAAYFIGILKVKIKWEGNI